MAERVILALDAEALFVESPLQTVPHTFARVASVRYQDFRSFLDRFALCVCCGVSYVFKEHESKGIQIFCLLNHFKF